MEKGCRKYETSLYSKHIFPVPWPLVKSRFHCKQLEVKVLYIYECFIAKGNLKKKNGV